MPGMSLMEAFKEVKGEEAEEEGAQRRVEEGTAFLWSHGRWRVHALAKVHPRMGRRVLQCKALVGNPRVGAGILSA